MTAIIVGVALWFWVGGMAAGFDPFDRSVLYRTATRPLAFGGLFAVLSCATWHVLPRGTSTAEGVRG